MYPALDNLTSVIGAEVVTGRTTVADVFGWILVLGLGLGVLFLTYGKLAGLWMAGLMGTLILCQIIHHHIIKSPRVPMVVFVVNTRA
jgi:hypothetical protein